MVPLRWLRECLVLRNRGLGGGKGDQEVGSAECTAASWRLLGNCQTFPSTPQHCLHHGHWIDRLSSRRCEWSCLESPSSIFGSGAAVAFVPFGCSICWFIVDPFLCVVQRRSGPQGDLFVVRRGGIMSTTPAPLWHLHIRCIISGWIIGLLFVRRRRWGEKLHLNSSFNFMDLPFGEFIPEEDFSEIHGLFFKPILL